MCEIRKVTVTNVEAGVRLDIFLSKTFSSLTRSRVKKMIEKGLIKVEGLVRKPSYIVRGGESILVEMPEAREASVMPEPIPLDVIYEDGDIIVINKKAGMVVHPGAGVKGGTLVNALLNHCKDLAGVGGLLRPGIVHRLDKGTSGVMIVAKNDSAHNEISRQFKARSVDKSYLALVYGKIPREKGFINAKIGRHLSHRKKMSTKVRRGREAVTEWSVKERFGPHFTLLDLRPHTGRTHQIRVHLSSIGHPLVGDDLYGGRNALKRLPKGEIKERVKCINRPVLHARSLSITHPRTGERLTFTAAIPDDIESLLNDLRRMVF